MTGRAAAASLLVVVLLGAGWALLRRGDPPRLAPASPERLADAPLVETLPPSALDVPVRIDVAVLLEAVEENVPTEWVEEGVEVGEDDTPASMAFARSPFAASIEGEVARLSAVVAYALRSSYELPLLPDIGLSCGTDEDQPAPRMEVRLEAPLGLTEAWTLQADTRVALVAPATSLDRDRCEVTFLGVDVTERVASGMRTFLTGQLPAIDSIVGTVDVRPRVESWWRILSEPIQLDTDVWLDLRPEAISHGDVEGTGDVVGVLARLTARPRVVFGPRPDAAPRPLPELGRRTDDRVFEATVDVAGDYGEISEALTRELAGNAFEGAGRRVSVDRVSVSGIGQNRIALEVVISGEVEGTLYLVGTPSYGGDDGFVHLPDLELSVSTSDLLVAGASWLLGAGIEGVLRERVRWPVEGGVAWAAERLAEGLNATLADGLRLRGDVGSLEVLDVFARTDRLLIRTRTTGRVELLVEDR